MTELTEAQRETLRALDGCTAPWDAQHRTNKIHLGTLCALGLATWQVGYPAGWVITPAGRLAPGEE